MTLPTKNWTVELTRNPRVTRETATVVVEAATATDACYKARFADQSKLEWTDVTTKGVGYGHGRVQAEVKGEPADMGGETDEELMKRLKPVKL